MTTVSLQKVSTTPAFLNGICDRYCRDVYKAVVVGTKGHSRRVAG